MYETITRTAESATKLTPTFHKKKNQRTQQKVGG